MSLDPEFLYLDEQNGIGFQRCQGLWAPIPAWNRNDFHSIRRKNAEKRVADSLLKRGRVTLEIGVRACEWLMETQI
jgi:hypothetical protein